MPSKNNSADFASRGVTAEELSRTKICFSGPSFLEFSPDHWPKTSIEFRNSDDVYNGYNLKKNLIVFPQVATVNNVSSKVTTVLEPTSKWIQYYSSLYKLKVGASWIARFKMYLFMRNQKRFQLRKSLIEVHETVDAELCLIRYVQRCFFSAEMSILESRKQVCSTSCLYKLNPLLVDSILRVGGRLDNATLNYDLRHPIILPNNSHFTTLIIRDAHANIAGHCGVNITLNILVLCQRFWILNAKVETGRVINSCVICKRIRAKPKDQLMASLPDSRLQINESPFSHVGIDFLGPFVTKFKRSNVKSYGCIFTCMTIRAVHLEMAYDLTTSFINVLRRFLSRRGLSNIFTQAMVLILLVLPK